MVFGSRIATVMNHVSNDHVPRRQMDRDVLPGTSSFACVHREEEEESEGRFTGRLVGLWPRVAVQGFMRCVVLTTKGCSMQTRRLYKGEAEGEEERIKKRRMPVGLCLLGGLFLFHLMSPNQTKKVSLVPSQLKRNVPS